MTPARLFLLVYGASGAAALVYEVAWTRLLTLHMGHGLAAASTVLAAFMGGLAAGAALGGQHGGRLDPRAALRAYAVLEVAIALLALLLPWELAALRPLLAWAYADGNHGLVFPLLRLGTSLVLVALPAAAMGATFPLASRWMVPSAARAPAAAGRLYAANTVGAALGAGLAGFVLLPALGLSGTTATAAALNVGAAGAAWWLAARTAPPAAEPARAVTPSRGPRAARGHPVTGVAGHLGVAMLALGLSGFASLALQVVWTRVLALVLGPTTYAFSVIVAVFIAGIAAGSALGARLAARAAQPRVGLAICLAASVGCAAAAAGGVDRALLAMAGAVAEPNAAFERVLAVQVLVVAVLLAPMAMAFGAAFPFAVAVGTRGDASLVRDLGALYATNTVGAIAGALLAGFVLVPHLGLHATIRALAVAGSAAAALLVLAPGIPARARAVGLAAGTAGAAAGLGLPGWDVALVSSGAYKYAPAARGADLETALTAGRILYYREGATATVAVRESAGAISLSIDGKVDASNAGDMLTQRLLAHVPLLLHPEPRTVAVLGLGSGVTLGSALRHPVTRVDVLEISREVVEASRFFEAENHGALADPRTRLILGDGRTHLMLGRTRYDVVISEPSNPWMAGLASLFTREFFASVRERLAPGGIFCQWAHTYDISAEDLRSVVATFLSVFPDGTLWLVGEGDLLLVGSTTPIEPRLGDLARHWSRPGVAADLASVGAREPFALLSAFVTGGEALARYAAGAPPQTDDRTWLEFTGPRTIFSRQTVDNAEVFREMRRAGPRPAAVQEAEARAGAAAWRGRGAMMLQASAFGQAWRDFQRALEHDPGDADALDGLIRAAAAAGRVPDTLDLVRRLAADPQRIPARLALSRLLAAQGAIDEAAALAFDAVQRAPDSLRAWEQLASVLADAGDVERLQPVVARLRRDAPASEITRYYTAVLLFLEGRTALAAAEAEALVRLNPRHARGQNLLGAALASLGERDRARDAFLASLRADPNDPATYTNLATLEMQAGNRRAAARRYAEALMVDPTSEQARRGLAEALGRP